MTYFRLMTAFIILIIGVFLLGECDRFKRWDTYGIVPAIPLPTTVKERVVVDTKKKLIYRTLPDGTTKKISLPSLTIIDLNKDGSVTVVAPQHGFNFQPFLGLSLARTSGMFVGTEIYYWKKLSLGAGGQWDGHSFSGLCTASYNVWSNLFVGVGYSTKNDISGLLYVRI